MSKFTSIIKKITTTLIYINYNSLSVKYVQNYRQRISFRKCGKISY